MSNATVANETTSPATIREAEAVHFGKLAKEWWDPEGSSAMLHRLNPVRLAFIRRVIDSHWSEAGDAVLPLQGKKALDIGCGAGLLCEPLARLGAEVCGVDAAPENVAAAEEHACGAGLLRAEGSGSAEGAQGSIRYAAGELSTLGLGQFDLVTAMEVIEHVADQNAFLAQIAKHLAPGGLLIMSTPNRTLASRALLVEGAERMGLVPRGTHHWRDFITPDELGDMLSEHGLSVEEMEGIAFSPLRGLHLSERDLSLNYILSAAAE